MTAALPMSEMEFQDLLRRVEDWLRRIEHEAQRLDDNVERWLHWVGPFGGGVRSVLDHIKRMVRDLVRTVVELLPKPGVPWTLWSHGNDWVGEPIGGRVSAQAAKSTLDEARVDDFWQGKAADAYKNTLPRQKEALAAIKAAADQIDDALTRTAIAISMFWIGVASVLATLIMELAPEIASVVFGVTAPAAFAAIAASAAKALAAVTGLVFLVTTYLAQDALPAFKKLRQQLHDRAAFPDGRWPRSTADISDGTLSDGDGTDWRMRS